MDINIITVHASGNYGSFLQAFALSRVLEKKYSTYIVEAGVRNIVKDVYFRCAKNVVKGIVKGNIKYSSYYIDKINTIRKDMKKVKRIPVKKAKGCFVFGSDEIWNLERKEMREYPVLWGTGIKAERKISYAPSLNGCGIGVLNQTSFKNEILRFNALSARDNYSCQTLHELTGRYVEKVLDPTMLLDKEEYIKNANCNDLSNYIALYLFHPSSELIAFLKRLKSEMNIKLISIGNWYDWCDGCVVGENPFDYYINASFVITNTFHGTAFAINLQKQFIAFARSTKINELLSDFHLEDRNANGMTVSQMLDLLNRPINYVPVERTLESRRASSLQYLFNAIETKGVI